MLYNGKCVSAVGMCLNPRCYGLGRLSAASSESPVAFVAECAPWPARTSASSIQASSCEPSDAFAPVWAPGGTPRVLFAFALGDGVIVGIDLVADPDRLARFLNEFITTEADAQ